jgi:hypothetical protein
VHLHRKSTAGNPAARLPLGQVVVSLAGLGEPQDRSPIADNSHRVGGLCAEALNSPPGRRRRESFELFNEVCRSRRPVKVVDPGAERFPEASGQVNSGEVSQPECYTIAHGQHARRPQPDGDARASRFTIRRGRLRGSSSARVVAPPTCEAARPARQSLEFAKASRVFLRRQGAQC